MSQEINHTLLKHLKSRYFNDKQKQFTLKKGELLIRQNEVNTRLFLVLKGALIGYLTGESGTRHEVFKSEENMFVGVHSFFSTDHIIYANVAAESDSTIAYFENDDLQNIDDISYRDDFLPLIVHELSARQRFSKDIVLEQEATLKQLHHNEKMSTLGQMAAGLAHELNNAIGVVSGNSEWITQVISDFLKKLGGDKLFSDFDNGFNKGHATTSKDIRARRKKIEKKFKISSNNAKRLAKLDYSDKEITELLRKEDFENICEKKLEAWELGVGLKDMIIASKQATHVVKSVKQLSSSEQIRTEVRIADTIEEALTILKKIILPIQVERSFNSSSTIIANSGELIQIWVNIIKNGCESMINAQTQLPKLGISLKEKNNFIIVDISNNGPEVPKETIDKIFQPNFTTKKDGLSFGLGLGLSIVQRLVDNYKGNIKVSSNKGITKFTIQIPIS